MSQNSLKRLKERVSRHEIRVIHHLNVGRAGSLLLLSLLDGHDQVLSFPGPVNIWDYLPRLRERSREGVKQLFKEVILNSFWLNRDFAVFDNRPISEHSFDWEKINQKIDENFDEDYSESGLFLFFHFLFLNDKKVDNLKVLFCHRHHLWSDWRIIRRMAASFPSSQFLISVRNPESNHSSFMSRLLKIIERDGGDFPPYRFVAMLDTLTWRSYPLTLHPLKGVSNEIAMIKIEDLQRDQGRAVQRIVDYFGISYQASLERTTFQGKEWLGDLLSTQESGIRKTAIQTARPSVFSRVVYQSVLWPEYEMMDYPQNISIWRKLVVVGTGSFLLFGIRDYFVLGRASVLKNKSSALILLLGSIDFMRGRLRLGFTLIHSILRKQRAFRQI